MQQQSTLSKYVQMAQQSNQPRWKEKRTTVRHVWVHFFGKAIIPDEQREFKIIPYDVSHTGLSFYSIEPLERGDIVLLICNERAVRLEVVWRESRDKRLMFHYGLRALNPRISLVEVFLKK